MALDPEPKVKTISRVVIQKLEKDGAFKDVKAVFDGRNLYTVRSLPDVQKFEKVELPPKEGYVYILHIYIYII